MECNRDEAIRAKNIAENKMQNNDFEGAQKIALKAKNLYPELENITQMLSICDVHCSAQKRFPGSEKDWYAVLQVEKFSDEVTIKKQYRRLALILHPDKNHFPGAEGAFKLICEANALLTDSEKKPIYDNKIRAFERSAPANPPNRQMNRSSQSNNQYGAQTTHTSNGLRRDNQHQVPQSTSTVFWTLCPFCKVSYQYLREVINRSLQCPTCFRAFVACEVFPRGVPLGSNLGNQDAPYMPSKPDVCPPSAFQDKVVTDQVKSEISMKKAKVPSTSNARSKGTANKKTAQPQPGVEKRCAPESIKVASADENLKTKETVNQYASAVHDEKVDVTSNGHATPREPTHTKSKSQKRGRKYVVQSDDSSDTDIEDLTEQENLDDAATDLESEFVHAQFSRRSSRRKEHVSYKETDEGDNDRPLKRAQTTKEDNEKEQKDADFGEDSIRGNQSKEKIERFPTAPGPNIGCKVTGASHSQEILKDKHEGCYKENEMRGVTGGKSSAAADTIEIGSDSDLGLSSDEISGCFDCPDPDFSDFDKLRDQSHFCVNQFWACYDDTYDGMPRFYAKVIKVSASPFELQIKWLEAVPINDACSEWVDEELPVGCGSFKLVGRPEKVSGCLSLSHQVHCEIGKKKGSHLIYPREGEVWALFRNWDISWRPKSHKEFRYEVVEVLSDFKAGLGINVCYLDKVPGFVSIFQRAIPNENNSFVIGPSELYKFSHYVPSFIMAGTERKGVPIGSFELDPAAIPLDPDHLYFPSKEKIERATGDPVSTSPMRCAEGKGNSASSGGTSTPRKIVDMAGTRGEACKPRRSPRVANSSTN